MCTRVVVLQLLLLGVISTALRCRISDDHTEAELKRIIRKCMRNVSGQNNPNLYRDNLDNNDKQQSEKYGRTYNSNLQNYSYFDKRDSYEFQSQQRLFPTVNIFPSQYFMPGKDNSGNMKSGTGNDGNNNRNVESCVAHCFFGEMNMLNNEEYPDMPKTKHALMKILDDRELREFYNDVIQNCFRIMDSQRQRPDKCSYSRNLIYCMEQYSKANCEDWVDYSVRSVVFN